jgi:hypothetical protein
MADRAFLNNLQQTTNTMCMKPDRPMKRDPINTKSRRARKRVTFNNSNEMKREPSAKACRRGSVTSQRYLRIGNLPRETNPEELILFLNRAMQQTNLCYIFESPIRNCLMVTSGDIACIGMSSPELAHKALSLTGIPYFGKELDIGRPKGYSGPRGGSTKTWQELVAAKNETSSAQDLLI